MSSNGGYREAVAARNAAAVSQTKAPGRLGVAVRRLFLATTAFALTFSATSEPQAAALQWDANGATAGSGGAATWNTSSARWFDGSTYRVWSNAAGDDAVFGGTAGTVMLSTGITVHNLQFDTTGYTVTGSTLTLSGSIPTVSVVSGGTATIGSVLAGANSLTQAGPGTLVLTGTNTYSGGTTISGGTLQIGSGGTSGSITGNVIDNGALIFNRSNALSYAGTISGTGSVTKLGAGTLTLTGDSTYAGGTTISAGTLQLGSGGTTGSIAGDVVDNGVLAVNRSNAVTLSGMISGTGALTKSGAGTLTLTADNTYTGTTTVSGGALQIGNGGTTGAVSGNIIDNATVIYNRSDATTFGGVISGTGSFIKNGTGTLTLIANNTYTGTTTINSGTLQIGNGGTTGALAGNVTNNSALIVNRSDTLTFSRVISGTGTLTQAGPGTLILTGANTFAGGTTVSAGTLQIGNGGTTGSIAGNIANDGAVLFNRSNALTYAGAISGTGSLTKTGAGTLTLTGDSIFTGGTTISGGTLQLGSGGATGSIAGNVVNNGVLAVNRTGTVTLSGTISGTGALTKSGSGTLVLTADNTYAGTTTVSRGVLQLGNGGTTGSVSGNIIDNATVIYNRSDASTFGGVISGTGSFTKTGTGTLTLTGANAYTGTTTIASGTLQIGNGGTTGAVAGNIVDNGALVFNRSDTLTVSRVVSGTGSMTQAGTGTVILTGANTYTGGTTIAAGTLQIGNGGTTGSVAGNIVDNGALVFNRSNALTYSGAISGTGSLTKLGTSSLTLTGANTYTGGTTVSAGTLLIGNGGTTGSIAGNIVDNGIVTFNRSNALTYDGVISGTGSLSKSGAGALTLAGDNTYTGTTTISAGSLQIGNGGTTGSVAGNIVANAALRFNRSDTLVYSGVISGSSTMTQLGTGTLVLTGTNTYTGTTTISAGTLQLGNGGTTGSVAGNIANNSALRFDRSDVVTFSRVISGTGSLTQAGTGTLILTGNNTFTGGTTIASGTLQIGSGGTTGAITGNIVDNGTLVLNRSNALTFAGTISGTGSLTKLGASTLTLTADNTYTGVTTISSGTLQLGNGGTAGAIAGDVINNGALIVNRSNAATLSGTISGTGSLTKTGAGTLTLTGDNTYSGSTIINAGTLQLGNGGTTGSIAGNIVDNGVLAFNRSDALTYAGVVSGTGSLVKGGAGTLTLTADQTYTGGTTIAEGTLQLGDGRTAGWLLGDVLDNGVLVFNRSDSLTYAGVISGTGSVTKYGAGTLTVTADQTYTGDTTIAEGTLKIGDGGATGSIEGDIVDNGALVVDRADELILDGVISGMGSFAQIGEGTTVLSGENTYTGGTTISAGTLQIGNGGATGSIVGDIVDNAALMFSRSDTLVYGGAISGSGSLTQAGPGTLILTGSNTYTGGTTVTGGTLQFGNGDVIGGPVGNIVNNGALVFNHGGELIYGGVISGSGSLVKTGEGTLIFTKTQTYKGGTTINGGTLQMGNGGAGGKIVGDIVDNATLVFDRSTALTFSGDISGTGTLVKNGAGTLTLTGDSTFTGGTRINAGVLQIGDGGTAGSIVGNIVDNAVLVFDRSNDLTFDGAISGTGSLVKRGDGALRLTGAVAYTGGTTVEAGALIVNGSLPGSLTVLHGALVEYNGNAGSATIQGTLAPGHSIGTMTIDGDLTFGEDSVYEVEVSPTAADRTDVTGLATLAGTVQIIAEPGVYTPDMRYTILSAGSISGTFAGFTSNLVSYTFVAPELSYDANNVYFALARTATFASVGHTPNQVATGAAVDSLGYDNPVVQSVLYGTADQARIAFDALSGEIHASAASAIVDETRYLRGAVLGRLYRTYGAERAMDAWVQPVGARGELDGDSNAASLSRSTAGLFGGLDMTVGGTWRFGAAGGYTQSWLDADGRASSGSTETYHLALYGARQFGALGLHLGFAHSWEQLEIERQISYSGFSDETTADPSAGTTQLFGELGYGLALGATSLEPFAGFSYIAVDMGDFSEEGGSAALMGSSRFDTTIATLGLRGSAPLIMGDRIQLALRGGLGWRHAFGDLTPDAQLRFAAGGVPFTVQGAPIARDALAVQAGIDMDIGEKVTLGVLYDGQLAAGGNDHGGRINLSLRF